MIVFLECLLFWEAMTPQFCCREKKAPKIAGGLLYRSSNHKVGVATFFEGLCVFLDFEEK